MESEFAFLWEKREAVDTDVEVMVEAESASGGSRNAPGAAASASKTTRLHKFLIAARSPYFKAQIMRWRKKRSSALRLEVPANEVAVSDAVFYFMYHERLPADPVPKPLACVSIARLADRLGMERCVDAALALLKEAPEEQLADPGLLNALLSLNQLQCQVVLQPSWRVSVLPRCREQLLKAFGTPFTILSTPALLQRFCQLDFDAVLEWARLDELCVDSENDVVAALHAWLAVHPAVKSDAALRDQLRRAVRPLHATSFFLCGPMPDEGWLELDDAVQLAQTKLDASVQNKAKFISKFVFYSDYDKAKWYAAAARTGAAPHRDGTFALVTKVPKSHVQATFDRGSWWRSEPVYFQGCFWWCQVGWWDDTTAKVPYANLGTYVHCKPLDASLSHDHVRNIFAADAEIRICRSCDKATGAPRTALVIANAQIVARRGGCRWTNTLQLPADLPHAQRLQAVLDDFIVDGHLVITTTLSGLNK